MRVRRLVCSGTALVVLLASCGDDGSDGSDAATTAPPARVASADVAATELVTGDCVSGVVIGAAERRTIDSARVVDCESVHELEVFATFDVTSAFETAGDEVGDVYPGEQKVVMAADEGCASRLAELGVDDGLGVIAIWPTIQSWGQADRMVTCAAFSEDGQPFQGRRLLAGGEP